MSIKIGFVHEFDFDSQIVRNFFEKNWERKIALPDKSFYEWQFINPPENYSKDHCVVAYNIEKKEILGAIGINKRTFFLNNKVLNGAEFTTWVTSKDTKNFGLGANVGIKILLFLQAKFDVLIGMGSTEIATPLYMRSGFRLIKAIPRFVKVINFDNIKKFSIFNNLSIKLINKWKSKENEKYLFEEVNDERYKIIFDDIKKKYNLFSRSPEYRNWRYKQHPYYKYKEFLIKTKDSTKYSYISFREENSLKEFKIIHLMDLFGEDITNEYAIIFLENYAKKHKYDVIDFYCTTSGIYKNIINNNWFSINDDDCFQFPHLFQPIEMRNPPTTSLIYWSKNNLSEIGDLSNLYFTKQDVDLDRPTLHTLRSISK